MEHGIPRLNECIHLFRHDYSKPNILQLINAASEIVDDTLVEIVLTGTLASGAMLFQCWNVKIAVKFGVEAKFFAVLWGADGTCCASIPVNGAADSARAGQVWSDSAFGGLRLVHLTVPVELIFINWKVEPKKFVKIKISTAWHVEPEISDEIEAF